MASRTRGRRVGDGVEGDRKGEVGDTNKENKVCYGYTWVGPRDVNDHGEKGGGPLQSRPYREEKRPVEESPGSQGLGSMGREGR